jgi:hypothetical protein
MRRGSWPRVTNGGVRHPHRSAYASLGRPVETAEKNREAADERRRELNAVRNESSAAL